jgi:DNA recombination protein RmuC
MSDTIGIVLIVIISVLLLFVVGLLILFFAKPNQNKRTTNNEITENKLAEIMLQNQSLRTQLETMQKTYATLSETVNKTGSASVQNIATLSEKIETMDKFQKDLNKFNNEIKTNLETLHTTTKNIPTISSEIKGITDIYRHAKNRGNFGEFQLSVILQDIFGTDSDIVKPQFTFKNGGVVDFIIKIGEHIVPIDAKFPLDNYQKINQSTSDTDVDKYKQLFKRDIVNKFKEVNKYLSPVDGINHVIIFIPSEGIFGDIVAWYGNNLLLDANEYHVFLCSPTTITAMLKLFVANEKDKTLSKNIENIKKQIAKIFVDFNKVAKN